MARRLPVLCCPRCRGPLNLRVDGELRGRRCRHRFRSDEGIPDLVYPPRVEGAARTFNAWFDQGAHAFDRVVRDRYRALGTTERRIRTEAVGALGSCRGETVLDLACGTGGDFPYLRRAQGPRGRLIGLDLSMGMLKVARERARRLSLPVALARAEAGRLPLPSGSVDAVLDVGGVNLPVDQGAMLREIFRVLRPGGRLVLFDEGLGPWLRSTPAGQELIRQPWARFYGRDPPVDLLPPEAKSVQVSWTVGETQYLLRATRGEAAPDRFISRDRRAPRSRRRVGRRAMTQLDRTMRRHEQERLRARRGS